MLTAVFVVVSWQALSAPVYVDIAVAVDTEAGDGFGSSVAIDGDTLAIGAYREGDASYPQRGALYVGIREAGGGLREPEKLVAPDAAPGDQNGFSVAIAGDWLATGAIGDFGQGAIGRSTGRVNVYRRDGGRWTHHRTLSRTGTRDDDRFGFSLALADGVLVVGARGVEEDTGRVYVYRLEEPASPPLELHAPGPSTGDRFGEAVAFDGRTLLVGAPGRNGHAGNGHAGNGSVEDAGAVFVFTADEREFVLAKAPLESPAPVRDGRFGVGVDVDGEHAVVGESHWRAGGAPGKVWFVARDAAGEWGRPYVALAEDDSTVAPSSPDDMEGFRVAIHGSLAVAGAHLADPHGDESGAVVAYRRSADGWRRVARLAPVDGDGQDHYGIALALDEGVVLVGAEQADARGRESGGIYVVEPLASP